MDKLVFIEIFSTLAVILAVLVSIYFFIQRKKKKLLASLKKSEVTTPNIQKTPSLESLIKIIKSKSTTTNKLKEASSMVTSHYGSMKEDFETYIHIILMVCHHPSTNKDIIISFERDLIELNPEYKDEINKAVMQGLNSRGA